VPLQLTHREREVLHLLAAGQTTKDIAAALSISPITVRNHVTRVIEKLDVKTRLQAVVAASHWGLI
jgi:DNA-binding CsgD family transcriptional regulator